MEGEQRRPEERRLVWEVGRDVTCSTNRTKPRNDVTELGDY
jgi:hypothetical protein